MRQVALGRVSPGPSWWRRGDPILDLMNALGVVAFFVTHVIIGVIRASELAM